MRIVCMLLLFLLIPGCAAKQVTAAGSRVKIVHEKPQGDCREVGEVTGTQGNWVSGGYTSNKNLVEGARNDMKNEAAKMGGTHVWLQNLNTNTGMYSNTVNALAIGVVYQCK